MLTDQLRPKKWEDVAGNAAAVKVFRRAIEEGSIRAFLLDGPTGIGKTTLARIAAHELGCHPNSIIEKNGADTRGIDDWRAIVQTVKNLPMYPPFTMVVVDEAQQLTKEALELLLKPIEDAPAHLYWIFCTTKSISDFSKTFISRVMPITLKAPRQQEVREFVNKVCDEIALVLTPKVQQFVVNCSENSFRQALVRLEAVSRLDTEEEQLEYLDGCSGSDGELSVELNAFCSHLLKDRSGDWYGTGVRMLQSLSATIDAEGVRQVVFGYMTKVALNSGTKTPTHKRAVTAIAVFSENWAPITRKLAGPVWSLSILADTP